MDGPVRPEWGGPEAVCDKRPLTPIFGRVNLSTHEEAQLVKTKQLVYKT